jgi:hypothetical protein
VSEQKPIELWLPKTITKVRVVEGQVTVWDEMEMEQRAIRRPVGFEPKPPQPPQDPSLRAR